MKRWFQSLTRFKQIGVSVLLIHSLIIFALLINHAASGRTKVRKPIAIRTTLLPKPAPATAPTQAAAASSPEKKKTLPPSPSKKVTPSVAPSQKKETDLLTQIADSLGAIATSPKPLKPSNFAPSLPSSIQIQTEDLVSIENPNYRETVSAILQNNLDLPEFGKVVVKIEIGASGNVVQCQILDSQSRKNGEFLKKRLQELSFPCFNGFGIKENQLTFTVTFQNVENT
jgi:hypothetical protein